MNKTVTDIIEQMRKDMDNTRKKYTRKLNEDLEFITDSYLHRMGNLVSVLEDEYLYKMDKAIRLVEESGIVKNVRLIDGTHVAHIDMFGKEKMYPSREFLVEWRDFYTHLLNNTLLEDDPESNESIKKSFDKDIDILHDALISHMSYERNNKEYMKIQSDLLMELFCQPSL